MAELSRRRFLATGAAAAGVLVVGSGPAAAATNPRPRDDTTPAHGDLRDVQHVVILMQENRSYDHYFGALRGGRGFGDRSTVLLPGGRSVFQQPIDAPGATPTGWQYPWGLSESASSYPSDNQPPNPQTGAKYTGDLPHSWDDQHEAWQGGVMNGWTTAKQGLLSMGYLTRADLPFHYALADAYTVGDAYHASVMSSTRPNRTYLWSGTIDAQRQHGSVTPYDDGSALLPWQTYAEVLQAAGVSWRVYQCVENFDNGLEYFNAFAIYDPAQDGTPAPGNPLYDNGVATVPEATTGMSANADNLIDAIRDDVTRGTLPRVSWVITNQAFSEHPDGSPENGAYLIDGILNALYADPDVFNSTVFVINYDENDGWFDHVPPPVAPHGTADEWCHGHRGSLGRLPVGLGFRVPLILVSPWTRGGWVTSEVSDHTSIIQFLEQWTTALGTPATCTTISQWRRDVCGDLTRAFDFTSPVYGRPDLPSTALAGAPPGNPYRPSPATNQMPVQEPGTKHARPLPYQPNANLAGVTVHDDGTVHAHLLLSNNAPHAAKSCHFTVYNNLANPTLATYPADAPSQYTVGPVQTNLEAVSPVVVNLGQLTDADHYDITVVGPNRFLRRFTGTPVTDSTSQVSVDYYPSGASHPPQLQIRLVNKSVAPVTFVVRQQHYSTATDKIKVPARSSRTHILNPLRATSGWYDVTVTRTRGSAWSQRYVGHLETGGPSATGS